MGNDNKNQQFELPVINHAPRFVLIVEPVMMAMIKDMLAEQREKMIQLIREN